MKISVLVNSATYGLEANCFGAQIPHFKQNKTKWISLQIRLVETAQLSLRITKTAMLTSVT